MKLSPEETKTLFDLKQAIEVLQLRYENAFLSLAVQHGFPRDAQIAPDGSVSIPQTQDKDSLEHMIG